jgi:uncharacterized protein YcnI
MAATALARRAEVCLANFAQIGKTDIHWLFAHLPQDFVDGFHVEDGIYNGTSIQVYSDKVCQAEGRVMTMTTMVEGGGTQAKP